MREMGLECLVKILQCLVVWYEELHSADLQTNEPDDSSNIGGSINGTQAFDAASVNQLAHIKSQKSIIESGIYLFSKKPKQGLAFLHQKGFVGVEPEQIAQFFHKEERLDKSVIGDYLGDGDE